MYQGGSTLAALRPLVGVYLLIVGVAVTLHFLATQFYDPTWSDASLPVWRILNPLQIIGVVFVVMIGLHLKRNLSGNGNSAVTRAYLEANVIFYYAAAVLIAHVWNWFGVTWSDPIRSDNQLWVLIDISLALLFIPLSIRLLRGTSD
jgi:hypothetical protein